MTGKQQTQMDQLILRQARQDDARLLWEWANDPIVRASSLSPDPILWESHLAWCQARLASASTMMLLAEKAGSRTPVGQVRFDLEDEDTAAIDISVAAAARNHSAGTILLEEALAEVRRRGFCSKVIARVKENNAPSRRLFEKACFTCLGFQTVRGSRLLTYQRILSGSQAIRQPHEQGTL